MLFLRSELDHLEGQGALQQLGLTGTGQMGNGCTGHHVLYAPVCKYPTERQKDTLLEKLLELGMKRADVITAQGEKVC